jgi:undecaprenyl-diphosphatase
MDYLHAVILGIVEGITEFLPISSTGHLDLTSYLLGLQKEGANDFHNAFDIIIQMGAILAVIAAYPSRFLGLLNFREGKFLDAFTNTNKSFTGLNGLVLLAITSIPAGLLGLAAEKTIDKHLHGPLTVAIALAVGAIWIIAVEKFAPAGKKEGVDSITWKEALAVGLFQCLALWPGMSRSACTILGGMLIGLERKTATEYSFFAAVPILFAASCYKMLKIYKTIDSDQVIALSIGFIVSFVFAWLAVKFLIHFLSRHTLVSFAWYRLALAALIAIFMIYHR